MGSGGSVERRPCRIGLVLIWVVIPRDVVRLASQGVFWALAAEYCTQVRDSPSGFERGKQLVAVRMRVPKSLAANLGRQLD